MLPPTYAVSSRVFLRLLGFIYLLAFASYWVQLGGLIGERGILPAGSFSAGRKRSSAPEAYWQFPSVFEWGLAHRLFTDGVAPESPRR